jgi:hypothetical protein
MDRETFKFIMTIVGSCVGVTSFFFTMFQYWRKKQDEKFDSFKSVIMQSLKDEITERRQGENRLEKRIHELESSISQGFERRLSIIEGELKGIKSSLNSILNWFVGNTPGGN